MKNKKKNVLKLLAFCLALISLTGCGQASESINQSSIGDGMFQKGAEFALCDEGFMVPDPSPYYPMPESTEEYNYIEENDYIAVAAAPLSTFSSDVDTASYTNSRRMLLDGIAVNPDAVRYEEFINYFDYGYDEPSEGEPFSIYTELSDCPWNTDTKLMMIGLSTKKFDSILENRPPMNLVFLLDTSGSMYDDNKLPLVKESFKLLLDNLSAEDRISIVTYAGYDEVLIEGASMEDKDEIIKILDSLEAGGSTAGAAGITTAYEIAKENFIDGGNNRIILATDGNLNVGLQTEAELTRLVEDKRKDGVFLSVLGFGTGNYKDDRMEALADNGNGNYSYIDTIREARRVLVDEMSGTLFTAAKDVKFQVEFNPSNVKGYRLIGYENRLLDAADFEDDTKDAGDIGAGHCVTALYEIVPIDSPMTISGSDLKYTQTETSNELSNELLTVSIRYKEPDEDESKLLTKVVNSDLYNAEMSEKLNFASCAAEFGMLLRDSKYLNGFSYADLENQLKKYDYTDDEYKYEFGYLVSIAKDLADN